MGKTLVYQCDTFDRTHQQAANDFAATNFGEPRRATKLNGKNEFKLRDGRSTYEVSTIKYNGINVYQIHRLDD